MSACLRACLYNPATDRRIEIEGRVRQKDALCRLPRELPLMKILAPKAQLKETPLDLTRSARDISVTERNDFKGCPRRWHLGTILNLEPRGVRQWYYDFGDGMHQGLEAFYLTYGDVEVYPSVADPLEAALLAFEEWYEKIDQEIQDADLGASTPAFRNEALEYRDLGRGMLENYNEFAVLNDDFTICCVEGQWTEAGLKLLNKETMDPPFDPEVHPVLHESGRFLVPIIDPETGKWIPGRPYLSAKLDLIVYVKKTGLRGFWIYDHKNLASAPREAGVEMDDQVTGYGYTFWRHTGIIPRGTVFNDLIKQLPKPPRINQTAPYLSAAKDQLTLPHLYSAAMQEYGLLDSQKHRDCLSALQAHGWNRFFKRITVHRNEHEYEMFQRRLPFEHEKMVEAIEFPDENIIPHLSQYNCPGCVMMGICRAMEAGHDYHFLIDTQFQQAKDRKAAK